MTNYLFLIGGSIPLILLLVLLVLVFGGIPSMKNTFLGRIRKWCDSIDQDTNICCRVLCFPTFLNKFTISRKNPCIMIFYILLAVGTFIGYFIFINPVIDGELISGYHRF
jgi:hypothetical protein